MRGVFKVFGKGFEEGREGIRTFFNFAFSAVSSFPAFAACRFSCFAVNCANVRLAATHEPISLPLRRRWSCGRALTLRLKSAFSKPDIS